MSQPAWSDLALLETAISALAEPFTAPFSRTGLAVMAIGWIIGLAAFWHYGGRGRVRIMPYLRHAFPRHVYLSRSFLLDLQLLVVNRVLAPARWILGGLGVSAVSLWMVQAVSTPGSGQLSAPALAALAACLLLAYDLGTYVTHRLSHQVPVLWAFHRVHHSAETLNPLTVYRKHPVYDAVGIVTDVILVAPVQAAILILWGAENVAGVVVWTNLGFGAFAYAASSLRHTHIWLSFGPVLDRIVVSPALHQVHHSRAPEHWDRNYGEVLAIWDWAFGSIYLPKGREELVFGLAGEDTQPHGSLAAALLEPFRHAWGSIRSRFQAPVGKPLEL